MLPYVCIANIKHLQSIRMPWYCGPVCYLPLPKLFLKAGILILGHAILIT